MQDGKLRRRIFSWQVLSLARMVEWLMVDTLRPRKAPPQQPAGGPKDD